MLKLRALKKSTAMLISIAMIVTLFAGLTMTSVSAAGTVVPEGTTFYDFTNFQETSLAAGTDGYPGFTGQNITVAGTKGYIQLNRGNADAKLTFTVNGTWSADFSSSHSNGPKGILITCPDGKQYATNDKESPWTLSNMPGGTYTITGIPEKKEYDDGNGTTKEIGTNHAYISSISFIVESSNPPSDVTNLTATPGNGEVTLTWNKADGADSYEIYVDDAEDSEATVHSGTTSYTVTGLENDKEHTFKVVAVNSAGRSAGVTTKATPKEPTELPGAFTLSGSGNNGTATLSWTASQWATSYTVKRGETTLKEGITELTYQDTGLTNGTTYSYQVIAVNKNGDTPSNTIQITPEAPPPSAIEISDAQGWLESAYVKWRNSAAVDKYNVYVKKVGGEYEKLDDQLVRYYGNYYRADALGLAAGQYQMKIAAVMGSEETDSIETKVLDVLPHTREGFAFDSNPEPGYESRYQAEGIGAYKMDGTLKDGAQILYIDDNNKDTVEFTVNVKGKPTTAKGLVNILALREKNGAEDTPLAIRMIGQVESPDGKNSSGYVQLKSCKNITFEGVGDDATTFHWSLLLRSAENVEVRNIAVMEFYDDGISLDTDNYNCWIHNCDIFYGQDRGGDQKKGDGSLDVKSGSDYCTFSYNHFWDSGKSSLCGMKEDSYQGYHMTYHHNWFDHSDSRHPRIRGDQVHIYNNYYDGNSKYGVGACTGGSAFVERNVFRNVKYPMLISMQASDVHGSNEGTFSGEDGGMIKAYDNDIQIGSQSQTYFTQKKPETDGTIDAYEVTDKSEQVPASYTSKQGGSKYSNFDTASNMYKYESDPVNAVVAKVETYAGRVQGGDFKYDFNDADEDADYDRIPDLGDRLKNYKTTLKHSYITPATYPATDGSAPQTGPTAQPIPTAGPTLKPGETPAPTNTPVPTQAPVMASPTTWDFGQTPFTVTEGDATHPDTNYFPAGGKDSKGNQRYSLKSDSITPENFGGLKHTTGKTTEDQYQSSSAEFTDGFKGTWQIKSNGGSFSFIPVVDGTVKVYAKHGSSTSTDLDNITIAQGSKTEKISVASSATKPFEVLTMDVVANQTVTISADQNTSYYGIAYTSDKPVPTNAPATAKPTDTPSTNPPATNTPETNPPTTNAPETNPPVTATPAPVETAQPANYDYSITGAALNGSGLDVTVAYGGAAPAPEGILLAAKYDDAEALTEFKQGPKVSGAGTYNIDGFTPNTGDNYWIYIWDSVDGMKPLCEKYVAPTSIVPPESTDQPQPTDQPEQPTNTPAQPTNQPEQPTNQPVTPPSGEAKVWNFGAAPWDTFSLALSKDDPTEQTIDGLKVGISKGIGKDGSFITANATEGLKLGASSACYFSYTADVAGTIKFTVQASSSSPYRKDGDTTLRSVKITKGSETEKEDTYCSADPVVLTKDYSYDLAAGETIKVTGGTNGFYLPALSFTPAGGSVQPDPSTPTDQPDQPEQPTNPPAQPGQEILWNNFSATGAATGTIDLGNGLTFIGGAKSAYDKGTEIDGITFAGRIKLGGKSVFDEENTLFKFTPPSAGLLTIYFVHGSPKEIGPNNVRTLTVYQGGTEPILSEPSADKGKSASVQVAAGTPVLIGCPESNIGFYGFKFTPGN